jgi:hypothetical protein
VRTFVCCRAELDGAVLEQRRQLRTFGDTLFFTATCRCTRDGVHVVGLERTAAS